VVCDSIDDCVRQASWSSSRIPIQPTERSTSTNFTDGGRRSRSSTAGGFSPRSCRAAGHPVRAARPERRRCAQTRSGCLRYGNRCEAMHRPDRDVATVSSAPAGHRFDRARDAHTDRDHRHRRWIDRRHRRVSADGSARHPCTAGRAARYARSYNRVWRHVETPYSCWLSDDTDLVPGSIDTRSRSSTRIRRSAWSD